MKPALSWLRRLTAMTGILLVLVGAIISGHARAAHIGGLSSASAPCHHAMSEDATSDAAALDLCRELCLSKVPDTAIEASGVQLVATATSDMTLPAYAEPPVLSVRPAANADLTAPRDRLRRSAPTDASTRLLI